jgi:hypothetical protein
MSEYKFDDLENDIPFLEYKAPFPNKIKRMVACIYNWQGTENFSVTSQKKADIVQYLLQNYDQLETLLVIDPETQKEFFDAFVISIAKKSNSNQSDKCALIAKRLSDWTCAEVNDALKARILRYFVVFHNDVEKDTVLSLAPISQKALFDAYLLEIGQKLPSGY